MKKITVIMIIFALFFAGVSFAAEKVGKKPIDITSESLEAIGNDIFFIGNVVAVYGDMTIRSDKMNVVYESTKGDTKGEDKQMIKKMIATGNVELIELNRHAWADKMVYERENGVATLTGNPKIKQKINTIAGDTIKVFLEEDRVEIKGNVKVIVNPDTIEE